MGEAEDTIDVHAATAGAERRNDSANLSGTPRGRGGVFNFSRVQTQMSLISTTHDSASARYSGSCSNCPMVHMCKPMRTHISHSSKPVCVMRFC